MDDKKNQWIPQAVHAELKALFARVQLSFGPLDLFGLQVEIRILSSGQILTGVIASVGSDMKRSMFHLTLKEPVRVDREPFQRIESKLLR